MKAGRTLAVIVLALAAMLAPSRTEARRRARKPPSFIVLDGVSTRVRWIDGDTFRFLDGARAGTNARLEGYNTLESYGPVHRWGGWRAAELLGIAHAATRFAAAGTWTCTLRDGVDRYRRSLVACPDLASELVRNGHAMVFAVDGPADPALLAAQRDAQDRRAGMWARGVPPRLPSSVHAREESGGGPSYDRLVDTRSGEARPRAHHHAYRTCEEVCVGDGEERACMLYVPFERRYRDRPRCLARSEPAGEHEPVRHRDDGGG